MSQQESSQIRGAKGQADAMQMDDEQIQTALPSPEHGDVQQIGQTDQMDMAPIESLPTMGGSEGVGGLEIQQIDTGSQQLLPQLCQPEADSRMPGTERGVPSMPEPTSVPLIRVEEAEEMSGQEHSTTNPHINEDQGRAGIQQAETSGPPSIDGGSAMEVSPMTTSDDVRSVKPPRKFLVPRLTAGACLNPWTPERHNAEKELISSYAYRRSKCKRRPMRVPTRAAQRACNARTLAFINAPRPSLPLAPLVYDLPRVPPYERYSKRTCPLDCMTWEQAVVKIDALYSTRAPLWKAIDQCRMERGLDLSRMANVLLLFRQTMHLIDTVPRAQESLFQRCQFPNRLKYFKNILVDFPEPFPLKEELILKMDRLFEEANRLNMAGR